MGRKNKAKKHHYVPQVYLKNFSDKNNDEYQTNVIDKKNGALYKANIKDVSCEKDYNRVENLENPIYWEEYYSKNVENKLNNFFRNLIAKSTLTLNNKKIFDEKTKEEFCKIIISQTYRSKKNRDKLMHDGEKVLQETNKELLNTIQGKVSKETEEYVRNWKPDKDFIKGETLKNINDQKIHEKLTKGLMEKNWVLYRNNNYKTMPFITSDNPVHIYNYKKPQKETGNSLIDENVIIYFAINERLMLAIFPKYIYVKDMSYINNKLQDIDDNMFIMGLYKRIYKSCSRQIYYKI